MAILGGLADGVDETDVRVGEPVTDGADQFQHALQRLRRLGDDAEPRSPGELVDVLFVEDDRVLVEIAHQAADFNMAGLPDHDGMPAFGH